MAHTGVLPQHMLSRLMGGGYITGIDENFLNPASIDLPLSGEAWQIKRSFLPKPRQTVRDWLGQQNAKRHDLADPLEVGATYVLRVAGTWTLPESMYGYANPKSSSGRIGLLCWTIADHVGMHDHLPLGWYGELWVLVRSDYFRVKLRAGLAIAQMRIFDGSSFLSVLEMKREILEHGLLFRPPRKLGYGELDLHRDSLFLTLAVSENMGWVSKPDVQDVIDCGVTGGSDPAAFFEPVHAYDDLVDIGRDRLYILSTAEHVMVAPHLSAELRAIDVRLGDFKSHAAGYVDPGWGYGKAGEALGRPITLEIIAYGDMTVQAGQRIARIRYEHMMEPPRIPYDSAPSNYTAQEGPALAKFFKKGA